MVTMSMTSCIVSVHWQLWVFPQRPRLSSCINWFWLGSINRLKSDWRKNRQIDFFSSFNLNIEYIQVDGTMGKK
jgi:hypothetical protein